MTDTILSKEAYSMISTGFDLLGKLVQVFGALLLLLPFKQKVEKWLSKNKEANFSLGISLTSAQTSLLKSIQDFTQARIVALFYITNGKTPLDESHPQFLSMGACSVDTDIEVDFAQYQDIPQQNWLRYWDGVIENKIFVYDEKDYHDAISKEHLEYLKTRYIAIVPVYKTFKIWFGLVRITKCVYILPIKFKEEKIKDLVTINGRLALNKQDTEFILMRVEQLKKLKTR